MNYRSRYNPDDDLDWPAPRIGGAKRGVKEALAPYENALLDESENDPKRVMGSGGQKLGVAAAVAGSVPSRFRSMYLIRHGATALNAPGGDETSVDRIRGWSDIPLSERGRDEARRVGRTLRGKGIGVMVHSDLSRAQETAHIIGSHIGARLQSSRKLRPWDLGFLTGESTDTALPVIARFVREAPEQAVPDGESFKSFLDRMFEGVHEAFASNPGELIALVTHHRVERALHAWHKLGQPDDHSIDLATMLSAGEPTGASECLYVNEGALDPREVVKASKAESRYRPGTEVEYCAICTMFVVPNGCTSVRGRISPVALCDYFERKDW